MVLPDQNEEAEKQNADVLDYYFNNYKLRLSTEYK